MEKQNKHKNLFLKFLPRAASAVNFQNPPFSPGRDHHHHHHHISTKLKANAHKGFSGPINFSVLPDEARDKPKNGTSYTPQEPTSPKVSCMGQIKYKHKKKKKTKKLIKDAKSNLTSITNDHQHHDDDNQSSKPKETKKSVSAISKFFSMRSPKPERKTSNGSQAKAHGKDDRLGCPSLGQMRKFASGRESLANFDWTAQIAPVDHDRDCYSDEERRRHSDDDDDDDEESEVIIPFSAPILVGGRGFGGLSSNLEPRKEINLWKRRTMDPPPPLTLKPKVR